MADAVCVDGAVGFGIVLFGTGGCTWCDWTWGTGTDCCEWTWGTGTDEMGFVTRGGGTLGFSTGWCTVGTGAVVEMLTEGCLPGVDGWWWCAGGWRIGVD